MELATKKIIIIKMALLLTLASISVNAIGDNSVRGVAEGFYTDTDYDDGNKLSLYGGGFGYYLAPVERDNLPWNEADFLQRASAVTALYATGDWTGEPGIKDYNSQLYAFSFHYADKGNPIIAQVLYSKSEQNWKYIPRGDAKGNSRDETIEAGIGVYLAKNIALGLGYRSNDSETKYEALQFRSKNIQDTIAVSAKWVHVFDQNSALNLEGGLDFEKNKDEDGTKEDNTILSVNTDYYITNKTSVGVGIAYKSGDSKSVEGISYGIGFNTYLIKALSIRFGYQKFNAKNTDEGMDYNGINASIAYWF